MNFSGALVVIGTILFLLFCASIIRIFNRSRTILDWFSYLLHQIGVLLMFILFLDLQLLLMLGTILIVWGAAYFALSWGEANLSPFWYSILIGISFVYFFMLLWWSGTKSFYRGFSFKRVDKTVSVGSINEKQSILSTVKSIMSSGMSFLIPLMIIIGLVMLGITCFGAFTSALVQGNSISFLPLSKSPDLSQLSDYYLWHFLELIPQIDVAKTLNWEVPFTYREKGVGWILLLFKALMAFIVIARFYTWNKWRKELNKESNRAQALEGSAIERLTVLKKDLVEEIENINQLLSRK